jgi:hypothetical protein
MRTSNKSKRRTLSVLGAALVAVLASSALAAGSASAATWHVKGEPYYNWGEFGVGIYHGKFRVTVPEKHIKIYCSWPSTGFISKGTQLEYQVKVKDCKVFTLDEISEELPCFQTEPIIFAFKGTGDLVSSSSVPYLNFESGKLCPIGLKNPISVPSLSLSYGEETGFLEVQGLGEGKFRTSPAEISTTNHWLLLTGGGPGWGWY